MRRFLNGSLFQGLQALALLFVLFGPDVVAMKSAPDSIDPIIDALLIASMVLFTLDLALLVLCRPRLSTLEARSKPFACWLAPEQPRAARNPTTLLAAVLLALRPCMHTAALR